MIQSLLMLVIYLLVIGLVFWLLDYVLQMLPIPDPFARIIRVILVVIAVIIVVMLLLNLIGGLPALKVGSLALLYA